MFNNLSDKLDKAFHVLKGHGKITEVNVAETLKEVRRALLDADVNFKIAKDFTTKVKEKAIGENVLTTLQPGQLLVKIVKDELTELMGGDATGINLSGNPTVILMSGLQGSGKTTFSGKLANYLKTKKNKKPLLVACDIYRPAAINQLQVVGSQVGVEVFAEPENKNPVDISLKAIAYAKANGFNVVIIDTAGRLAIDEDMMKAGDRRRHHRLAHGHDGRPHARPLAAKAEPRDQSHRLQRPHSKREPSRTRGYRHQDRPRKALPRRQAPQEPQGLDSGCAYRCVDSASHPSRR